MKIGICLHKYFPFGGLQRDFIRIAQELSKRGHSIRVYARSWEGEVPDYIDLIKVPVTGLSNHVKNEKFYHWVMSHIANNPVDKLVGFNKMPNLDVYYGADVCFAQKMENKPWFYRYTPRYRHYLNFEAKTVGRGIKNKLLIITPNQKRDFQKYYQTEDERFFLLPPGISKDRKYSNFPADARLKFRNEFNLKESDRVLLQIGSNYELKGVDRSIQAISALPEKIRRDVFLFVVGQDNPDKFRRLSQKYGIDERIKFFGGRDDVPRFIAGSDLFLHPARLDNTGTVILEALVGGLPEIVTEVCGYSVYVKEAKSGMVLASPFNQEELNQTLFQALSRPEELKLLKQNACHFADTEDLYSLPFRAADIILE